MLRGIDLSTSGLVAQRQRMNTIAGNIANAYSTRDGDGNVSPFQRRFVTFSETSTDKINETRGVGVEFKVEIDTDKAPRMVHEPGHPDANEEGYVAYPDINMVTEFVNAVEASRAYQANVAAIDMAKQMANTALRILA